MRKAEREIGAVRLNGELAGEDDDDAFGRRRRQSAASAEKLPVGEWWDG